MSTTVTAPTTITLPSPFEDAEDFDEDDVGAEDAIDGLYATARDNGYLARRGELESVTENDAEDADSTDLIAVDFGVSGIGGGEKPPWGRGGTGGGAATFMLRLRQAGLQERIERKYKSAINFASSNCYCTSNQCEAVDDKKDLVLIE